MATSIMDLTKTDMTGLAMKDMTGLARTDKTHDGFRSVENT
jgi:hypothetical protein